ncbi:MAG TPA: TfoX/Sxy family protein [Chloroflexota bacterium]|nr:TfoX/Sxy family protein [Chloroflexota bacterium]
MFGGLSFMVSGNMSCGVIGETWSCGSARTATKPRWRGRTPGWMDFTGRPMAGWIYVAPEGVESESALVEWAERGLEFARSLPPK